MCICVCNICISLLLCNCVLVGYCQIKIHCVCKCMCMFTLGRKYCNWIILQIRDQREQDFQLGQHSDFLLTQNTSGKYIGFEEGNRAWELPNRIFSNATAALWLNNIPPLLKMENATYLNHAVITQWQCWRWWFIIIPVDTLQIASAHRGGSLVHQGFQKLVYLTEHPVVWVQQTSQQNPLSLNRNSKRRLHALPQVWLYHLWG